MFDFFNKKEVDDPALLEQIIKDGVDYAAERFSSILMQDFLTTSSLAYGFVMQELDGARQGNDLSIAFVKNSGVAESEYKDSLNHDTPELDISQEWMQLLTSKLYPRMDVIVPLRLGIVKCVMEKYNIGENQLTQDIIEKSIDMHLKDAKVDVVAIVKNSQVVYINEHLNRLFTSSSTGKFDGRVVKFNFRGIQDNSSVDVFVAFNEQDAYTLFTLNFGRDDKFNDVSQALIGYFKDIGIASSLFSAHTDYATQQEYAYKLFNEGSGYYMINNSRTKTYTINWDGMTEG